MVLKESPHPNRNRKATGENAMVRIAERLRAFISSIETNRDEWQSVLDSLSDPTGNMEDYLLALSRHFGL